MTSAQREIESIMKGAGFWVLRTNKHVVWTDGKVKVSTAMSASKPCGDRIRSQISLARARAR